jgi:hypothetical protein
MISGVPRTSEDIKIAVGHFITCLLQERVTT